MALKLFARLCSLFGKACALLALLFIDEVETLCADVLRAQLTAGQSFLDRCRSGLQQARSRLLRRAPGLEATA